jgi:ribosome maturation factor RimP
MNDGKLAGELEQRLEALGYEMVELEQVGQKRRPILRLKIDRPDSTPGAGVTVEDCRIVSRALESYLDERPGMAEAYVLEVSSHEQRDPDTCGIPRADAQQVDLA